MKLRTNRLGIGQKRRKIVKRNGKIKKQEEDKKQSGNNQIVAYTVLIKRQIDWKELLNQAFSVFFYIYSKVQT